MTEIVCYAKNCDNHGQPNKCKLEGITVVQGKLPKDGTDDTSCGDFQRLEL